MSKQTSSCLNRFNEYFYIEFNKLAKDARDKNNNNLSLIYKKVAHSIQKYPFPLLTASQAMLLEGVGESTSKIFEKLLTSFKEKIENEKINYLEMSHDTNQNYNQRKKGGKRKALTDSENESKKNALDNKSELKKKKKLVNIEMYSSIWSSVVCSYILFLQNNSLIFEFDDIVAISKTLTDELGHIKKNFVVSEGLKDFKEMKTLNLIENIDIKDKKIKITDFLIKLAKIELKKSGILVEQNEKGELNFTIVEEEDKNEYMTANNKSSVNNYLTSNNNISASNTTNYNNRNNINNFNQNGNLSSNIDSGLNIKNFNKTNLNLNNIETINSRKSLSISFSNNSSKGRKSEVAKNSTLDSFIQSKKKNIDEEGDQIEDDKYEFNLLNGNQNSNLSNINSISNNISRNIPLNLNMNKNNGTNSSIGLFQESKIKTTIYNDNSTREINYTNISNKINDVIPVINNNTNNFSNNNICSKNKPCFSINTPHSSCNLTQKLIQFKRNKSNIPADNVILIVDNREKGPNGEKFPEEIFKIRPDIRIREGNLAIGDFMWIYIDPITDLEFVLDFVIERKTIEDLAKSILDGRYNEQKYRLKNCGIKNIYYVFEGTSNSLPRGNISKSGITSAIFNTLNIHDINIIKTSSIEDSVDFLIKMDDMVRKNAESYSNIFLHNMGDNTQIQPEFITKVLLSEFTQSNGKTKNSSIENIFIRQLRCFDDCGAKSVDVLRNVFKCPRFIFEIFQKIGEEEKTKENLIVAASYLFENNLDLSEENIIHHAKPEIFYFLKKEVKSVKKIRKTTTSSIIKFYS